jgi:outer membrane protein
VAKLGVIYAMNAITATKEGQKAGEALTAHFQPKKDEIDKLDASIQANTDKLRKGATTMSVDAQKKLSDTITADTKTLNREKEDAQAELDDEQGKITQQLGEKMMTIVTKYGTDNCYSAILDVSNQQTPVLWYATGTDITADIIKLYDEKYPVAAAAAAPAGAPAKPAAAPAAPAGKKQP